MLNGSPQSGFGLDWIVSWVIAVRVGFGCCSGLKEDFTFYIFGFGTLDFEKCNRCSGASQQGLQAEGAQRGPVLVGTFFTTDSQTHLQSGGNLRCPDLGQSAWETGGLRSRRLRPYCMGTPPCMAFVVMGRGKGRP